MVVKEGMFEEGKYYIRSVKQYSKEELEIKQQNLYKDFYDELYNKRKYLYKFYKKYENDSMKIMVRQALDDRLIVLGLENELERELTCYLVSIFTLNVSDRRKYLEKFAKRLVDKYCNIYPEEEILRPFLNNIAQELYYQIKKDNKSMEKLRIITKLFEIETMLIGKYLKEYIPYRTTQKVNSIIESCMHILMSSSSDALGNHLNLIEQSNLLHKQFLEGYEELRGGVCDCCNSQKLDAVVGIIKELGSPLEKLIRHNEMQSKMFRSFKNEQIHCDGANLEFILNFVFVNGFKVKFPHVAVKVRNELSNGSQFLLNEYIVTNAIYAILENAIEANACEIQIHITNNNDFLNIDISNNGIPFNEEHSKYFFEKGFSTKDKHSGIGLSIAKNWVENVSCGLKYIKGGVFRISISLEK